MDSIDVIVSGHLCLDLIPRMVHVPAADLSAPGQLSEVGPLDIATGGAVANTGQTLHRLGVQVRLMGIVGDDLIGNMILRILTDHSPTLTQHLKVVSGQTSSYTIILSPERVDRIFLYGEGTNALYDISDIDFAALAQTKIFHLGYPPTLPRLTANNGAQLRDLFQRAQAFNVITSLDMTLPDPKGRSGQVDWQCVLRNTLPYVDIFLPSIEETVFALRRPDYDAWRGKDFITHISADYLRDLADEVLASGVAITGFKLGERGLYLKTAAADRFTRLTRLPIQLAEWVNREVYTPAYAATVVGTTGAGDSAYAGFLAALLRGLLPDETARRACAVGACNVEAADALSGIRTWEETQARLDAGWPLHTARVPGF